MSDGKHINKNENVINIKSQKGINKITRNTSLHEMLFGAD